ncbi:putative ABC transporter D family member 2, chloroplastic isoform X1 [Iris pallida]|uniref:ABC transporter D family member 2, chloroplastic isoform X1 n=1 Tax=Iris pallida TaxID=29817 RepID=A0AAX6FN09_IRIPA|nr:putative ABC transporter D family member 2, chloroplastic isoform X1 [Iris pallida]
MPFSIPLAYPSLLLIPRFISNSPSHAPLPFSSPLPMRHRRRTAARRTLRSSATADDSQSPVATDQVEQRIGPDLQTLSRRFWKVAAPYWSSEDKVQARLRLAAVFALTLGTTGISVGFSFLGRDFYNSLANKDQEQFTKQLIYYLGAFAGGIPFFVLRDYARETLSLRWRSWMTSYYMERYLKNQTFYKIQSQSLIDNPDQRIVDDLSSFTGTSLAFSLTVFNAAVDLISFSNILFGIYPPLFVVLLVYSLGGTAISVFLGKGLVPLNFMQEKKEADFRYALVRVRENAESIAFYGGEDNERQLLLERFKKAFENLSKLLISSRNLEFFTNGYRYLIQILPAAVVAPMYFSGKIEFGVINQSVSAFNHILSDFSLIVYQFQAISAFSAVIDRLGEFDDILDGSQSSCNSLSDGSSEIEILCSNTETQVSLGSNGSILSVDDHKLLEIKNLTLQTPRSRNILITDLSLEITDSDHLLVMGPSGCGKTSFLRALAGLWTTGEGNITFYMTDAGCYQSPIASDIAFPESQNGLARDKYRNFSNKRARGVFFLPQRPYMVLGTLREQLLYPTWTKAEQIPSSFIPQNDDSLPFFSVAQNSQDVPDMPEKPTVDDLMEVLKVVHLGDILSRFDGLDSMHEWSSVLSLGEQQRLAFARLLLSKPKLALLDESTSALDEANEAHLYRQIEAAGITYISVGHRSTLYKFHKKVLHISKFDSGINVQRNWHLELINQITADEEAKSIFGP